MARLSKDGPPPIRPSNEGFLATPAAAAKPEQWRDELNTFSAYFCFLNIGRRHILKRTKFNPFQKMISPALLVPLWSSLLALTSVLAKSRLASAGPASPSLTTSSWAAWVSHFEKGVLEIPVPGPAGPLPLRLLELHSPEEETV